MTDSKKNPGSRGNSGLAAVLLALIMAGVHAPPTGATEILSVTGLDGSNGFTVKGGDFSDYLGRAVSGAGDVNGDGLDDLIVGAYGAGRTERFNVLTNRGESYVIFGRTDGFPASISVSGLDGSNGFAIRGHEAGGRSGFSVSGAGDLNGDGFADLAIGAPAVGGWAGEGYVVFGRGGGFPALVDLGALDGTNGFTMRGGALAHPNQAGYSVSGAGDVNGDGMDDLLIGAPQADGAPGRSGETYVVYGKSGFGPTLDLGMLDAASGLAIKGAQIGEWSGEAVSAAGDLNADGFDDLVIGAPNYFRWVSPYAPMGMEHAGRAYVVFGAGNFAGGELALSELDGSNGFVFDASAGWDEVGTGVGGGGDFNGDGIADVLVSAPGGSPPGTNGAGETYVIFGHGGDFDAALDRYALDGTNGFILGGTFSGERTGRATSFAGDLNGDGFDDLLIGAPWYQRSYVVYGRATVPGPIVSLADLGTTGGFLIQGIKPGDRTGEAVGGAGDLNGDGIADLVVGAPQADNYGNSQGDHGQAYVVFGVASAVPEPDSAALFAFSLALFVARGRRSRAPRRPQRRGRD